MKKTVLFLGIILLPIIVLAYPKGDVDGDNSVTAKDYILIRRHILKNLELKGEQLSGADVNGDGNITILDYIEIRKIILGVANNAVVSNNAVNNNSKGKTTSYNSYPNNVTLNVETLSIPLGDSYKLVATVTPSDALDTSVTWVSSNSKKVTVDKYGNIKGVSKGSATITVSTVNGLKAKCKVSVTNHPTSISLNRNNISLMAGNSMRLTAKASPDASVIPTITWKSSNPNIASVDSKGIVKGIRAGTATITATTKNGKKATCTVKVSAPTPTPRPTATPKVTASPKPKNNEFQIVYKGNGATGGSVDSHICKKDSKCTIKDNGFVKSGYTFIGWTTRRDGTDDGFYWTGWSGNWTTVNGSFGVMKNKLTLYARWAKVYDVTQDSAKIGSYSVVKQYSGSTFKYKILKVDSNTYYSVIWVKDGYKQINNALAPKNKTAQPYQIIKNEISKYPDLNNKHILAVNGSFKYGDTVAGAVIISHGELVRDISQADYIRLIGKESYDLVAINKSGWFSSYSKVKSEGVFDDQLSSKLLSYGARNTWATVPNPNSTETISAKDERTAVCQIDLNNFVIISTKYRCLGCSQTELRNIFGCQYTFNLDGGGSVKLYYRDPNGGDGKILLSGIDSKEGTERTLSDMMYFSD